MLARNGIFARPSIPPSCAAGPSANIILHENKIFVKFSFLTEILTSPCYDGHSNSERMMKMTHAKKAAAQVVLLIAGAAMLCFGAWRGEAATVFSKAIKLCLECVGIG